MYFDRRLWALTKGLRLHIMAGVALGLLALAAGIARFGFLGALLAMVFRGAPWSGVAQAAADVVAMVLLRAVLDYARAVLAHRTAGTVQLALRLRLFDKLAELGPAWFGAERSGGVMLTVVDGVEQLQTFFGQYLPQLITAACAPAAIFLFMAWWDLPVAAALLAGALVALVAPAAVHMWDHRASRSRSRDFKRFGEELLDGIQGLPALKAFGQSEAYGESLAEKARALSRSTFAVLAAGLATRGITDLAVALAAAAGVVLGAWRVSQGQMSLEALLIVLMAGTEIFRPLRDLRGVLHQGMLGRSAAEQVHALLQAQSTLPAPGSASPVLEPAIAFDDVHFAYPGGRLAAHRGLSFQIAKGERIGVVGPSGAGKSSIVRLLLREADPQRGAVRIGGHDLRTLDPELVRSMIAVVAQDSALFYGTVEENLRLGRPEASAAQVEQAARDARAHGFIMALPQGYQTVLGERGARLSGGQRQRLAIARALLRDSPILILDEALSAVDASNEADIQAALDRLMQGRTTLVLAHRLSSVIGADRILVLEDGRVAESGRHEALMRQGGTYARLMGGQAAEADGEASALLAPPEHEPVQPNAPLPAPAATAEGGPVLAALLGFIRPWRWMLALVVLCGVGRVAAFIGVGALGALVIQAVRAGQGFTTLAVLLVLLAPVTGFLHWLESYLAHDMAYKLLADMRIALFRKLDQIAPAYLLRRRAGDLVALAAQDVETVEYFYAHTVAPAVVSVLAPASVMLGIAWVDWRLAAVLSPFLAYAMLSPVLGRSRIDRLGAQAREALGLLGAQVTETVQGLSDLIAFQAVAQRRAAFQAVLLRYRGVRLALLSDLARQAALLEAATSLGGLAVALTGAWLAAEGRLDAGLLPLLILLSVAAFLPVSEIAQAGRQLADTLAATRRLAAVHAEPVRITDGTLAPPMPLGGCAVSFEEVGFTYPGEARPALDGVTVQVGRGAHVALVGRSGAGKSTLAHLLLRFWDPDQGRILLDGVPLPALTLDALRSRIALVAQDTTLFNDTLEANIRLARPGASAADLSLAISQAALTRFVDSLPEGLATQVGERGVQLSGGQRQRIAIARAFLKDAPVLVLDEATSHLDAISEAEVRAALSALMADRTTLVIAHRLSTIRDADLILVMDRGRVVEQGTHQDLVARGGAYARLVDRQMAGARLAAE